MTDKTRSAFTAVIVILFALALFTNASAAPLAQTPPVHILYFYAEDCAHCKAVNEEVLKPMEAQYGEQLVIHRFEINQAANYEGLVRVELAYKISAEQRGIPTLVIGDRAFVGENDIREQLPALVEGGLSSGIPWPNVAGLEYLQQQAGVSAAPTAAGGLPGLSAAGPGVATPQAGPTLAPGACAVDSPSSCDTGKTIWVAYFYQVGCEVCSIAHTDLKYLREKHPNVIVEEFNIYDQTPLAEWMAARAGRSGVYTPAVFAGQDALIGGEEITPQNLENLVTKYEASGTTRIWDEYDPSTADMTARFRSLGPLTVVFAGLVDGLNPCAFATMVFFVSYLAISGRKGRQILMVGAGFTLGVFLAYLVVGLGFYKVLELLGDWLTTVSHWVYGLTAALCAVLAVLSFLDFLKARKGNLGDMTLNLPHALRARINQVIRENRAIRAYVAGAFITGLLVSLLELACTGQIYLPTIIFVSSIPALRPQAILYLLLYNLMFIVPLVIVFVLAYFGTTSKDLTGFLQRNAAAVKLGMMILFASLAIWLTLSLIL